MDLPWALPSQWRWERFGDVARVASDLVQPSQFLEAPHVAPNHIESDTGRLLPFKTIAEDGVVSAKHRFHAGQILYSKIRPYLAKAVYVDFDGLCSADMYPIDTELEPRFLKWWMLTREFTRRAAGEQARTVLPKINRRALERLPVPVPPTREQQRIVDILEDHLSRLDAAEACLVKVQKRARTLRATLRDGAASGTLEGHERSSDGLASSWRWVSPADIAEGGKSGIVIGPFGSSLKTSDYRAEGVPLIFVRNVRQGYFGPVGQRYVSPEKAEELSSHAVRHGDVLITKMGDPPGDAAVYDNDKPGIITADVIRLRPRADQCSEYLALAINSSLVAQQMSGITRGVAQRKVSLARFRSEVQLPVPDPVTQFRVAERAAELQATVDGMSREAKKAMERSVVLRRAVLQAAFSGALAGRPSDVHRIEELAGV